MLAQVLAGVSALAIRAVSLISFESGIDLFSSAVQYRSTAVPQHRSTAIPQYRSLTTPAALRGCGRGTAAQLDRAAAAGRCGFD